MATVAGGNHRRDMTSAAALAAEVAGLGQRLGTPDLRDKHYEREDLQWRCFLENLHQLILS
jgi:hypothetical protein